MISSVSDYACVSQLAMRATPFFRRVSVKTASYSSTCWTHGSPACSVSHPPCLVKHTLTITTWLKIHLLRRRSATFLSPAGKTSKQENKILQILKKNKIK